MDNVEKDLDILSDEGKIIDIGTAKLSIKRFRTISYLRLTKMIVNLFFKYGECLSKFKPEADNLLDILKFIDILEEEDLFRLLELATGWDIEIIRTLYPEKHLEILEAIYELNDLSVLLKNATRVIKMYQTLIPIKTVS